MTDFTNELLAVLPTTKEGAEMAAQQMKSDIEGGYISPLKIKIALKAFDKVLDEIKEPLRLACIDEAETYGEKEFSYLGAKVRLKETGVKWDFDNCKDPYLQNYVEKEKELKETMKGRQKFLQSLKEQHTFVDEATGETHTVYPPVKKSTTQTEISL